MRGAVVCLLPVLGLLVACGAPQALVDDQARQIDSLYVIERNLLAELYAMQDSLRFFEDIDSGQYYRERRTLEDRITRLDYLLAVRADSLCADACALAPVDTLLAEELFEPASATISEAGTLRLASLAAGLDSLYARRRFRVEGHADNVPPGATLQQQYPTNWELAAARAAAVVRYLVAEHGFDGGRFEVVSFGATQPVASNATAAGRRLNRRIVLYALPVER